VKMAQMFLKDKVKLLQSWYPAVHSLIQCSFGGRTIDLPNVADTSRLLVQQTGTGDIVAKNFMFAPLLPFKGGQVRLIAGLFAIKGQNQAKEFITIMGGFAKLLAVPQISAVLDIAAPLAEGVQTLVGGGGLHLGYHNSWVGAGGAGTVLSPGYFAVIRSTDAALRNRLLVVNDELYEGASLADPARKPFEAADFMLLHVEMRETRDDWNELASISKPYTAAIDALGDQDEARADAQVRLALTAALKADELTKADRRRVVDSIKADYEAAKGTLMAHGLVDAGLVDLQVRMDNVARIIDYKKAVALGEPTWNDVAAPVVGR